MGVEEKNAAIFARLFPHALRKGDHAKIRIIQAAIECIGTIGVDKMTFHSVGQIAGMNAGHVKYHFNEKEDLLRKAIEFVQFTAQETVLSGLEKAKNWEEQVFALINGFFDWAEALPHHGSVFLFYYYYASIDEKLRDVHTRQIRLARQRITTILNQGREERNWTEKDIALLGDALWAVTDGFILYQLTTTPEPNLQTYREKAVEAVTRLLRK